MNKRAKPKMFRKFNIVEANELNLFNLDRVETKWQMDSCQEEQFWRT